MKKQNDHQLLEQAYQQVYQKAITESISLRGMQPHEITHSKTHNTQETYDSFVKAYEALHPVDQSDLRGCAYIALKTNSGSPTASSVSSQIYEWFREYGSFNADVMKMLRKNYL